MAFKDEGCLDMPTELLSQTCDFLTLLCLWRIEPILLLLTGIMLLLAAGHSAAMLDFAVLGGEWCNAAFAQAHPS